MAVKLKKDTDVKEQALNILLNNVFIENRKTRRWGIFLRYLLLFIFLFFYLCLYQNLLIKSLPKENLRL